LIFSVICLGILVGEGEEKRKINSKDIELFFFFFVFGTIEMIAGWGDAAWR
jgi:hypothetical protein